MRDLGGEVQMLEVAGAGHFVIEEAPEVTVPAIAEFLRASDDAGHDTSHAAGPGSGRDPGGQADPGSGTEPGA